MFRDIDEDFKEEFSLVESIENDELAGRFNRTKFVKVSLALLLI
jgi:hypothetical protein